MSACRPIAPKLGHARVTNEAEPSDDRGSQTRDKMTNKQQLFACPFNKKDPILFSQDHEQGREFHSCPAGFKWTSLITHIEKRHQFAGPACRRCWMVFVSFQELEEHHRNEIPCSPTMEHIEGIVPSEMISAITKKRRRGPLQIDSWFEIWDLLFPRQERPVNPYMETVVEHFIHMVKAAGKTTSQGWLSLDLPETTRSIMKYAVAGAYPPLEPFDDAGFENTPPAERAVVESLPDGSVGSDFGNYQYDAAFYHGGLDGQDANHLFSAGLSEVLPAARGAERQRQDHQLSRLPGFIPSSNIASTANLVEFGSYE